MTWTKELDVGVAAMNKQHQILIEIMNRLHDQFETGASHSEQPKSLEELGVHKADFDENGELTSKFFAFLKLWLKAHIMGIDEKYGSYSA